MPGCNLPSGIGQSRLHLNVARGLVHDRVQRRNPSGEGFARQIFGGDAQAAADMHLGQRLLRQTEIHINRIQSLKLNHRASGRQILAEIDLANPQHSRKRRANGLSLNGGADFAHIRFGLLLLGAWPGRTPLWR